MIPGCGRGPVRFRTFNISDVVLGQRSGTVNVGSITHEVDGLVRMPALTEKLW